ncbi:hypothetical protein K8R20_03325 [bacterium]|nr:hypothetical protein [bacterium]
MRKLPILQLSFLVIILSFFFFSQYSFVHSGAEDDLENDIENTQDEIEENESLLESIEARISEITNSNYSVSQQIALLSSEIGDMQEIIDEKDAEIDEKLEEIEAKEEVLLKKKGSLSSVSSQLYMESRVGSIEFIFSNSRMEEKMQTFFVKRTAITVLKDEISEITGEFDDLNVLKRELDDEKKELDGQREELDASYDLLMAEKKKLESELNEKYNSRDLVSRTVNGLKAELSDLQYQLLIVRQGGTNVNINSVPASSSDVNGSLAGFMANAPSNTFGVFSIGAYTHRNGMSQWGAKARDDAGQSYSTILDAYYPGTQTRTGTVVINGSSRNIMENITVDGYGTMSFEDSYLHGIREINGAWNVAGDMDVLKAQVIAARTYAVRRTNNGASSICATQSCQVYSSSHYTGAWVQAINETRGQILTDGAGNPVSTQYAAVHGGWSNTSGWDTTNGNGNGDWMANAYDSISGVSWFYKTWYRYSYTYGNTVNWDSCYRNPWLTQAEMSDIVNAYQVWVAHNRSDSRIVPITINDPCRLRGNPPSGANPYSHSELRNLAAKPVTSVSMAVTSNGGGSTSNVTFYTNAGSFSMSGNDFKTIYNMRAPGHLRIPQSGFVHVNVEKKP